jgi:hypothetical protein
MRRTLTAIALIATTCSAAIADDERHPEMVGHYLRVNYSGCNLLKCPVDKDCPGRNIIPAGTGYTILGFADTHPFKTVVKVKLDDGQVGYFVEFFLTTPRRTLKEEGEAQERCRRLPSIGIGATKAEVRESKWGDPYDWNITETSGHVREQWVYKDGPMCTDYGLPNAYDKAKYLYFEDGRLVTIQR